MIIVITNDDWNALIGLVRSIDQRLTALSANAPSANLEAFMADTHKSLDDIIEDLTSLKSRQDALVQLASGLRDQVGAITAGSLTPDQQAKVDAIFDAVEERKAEVQAAIDKNTPAAALPPETPVDPNAPQVNPLQQR
jgi:hypothetical protein